jgi:hypothetical protein
MYTGHVKTTELLRWLAAMGIGYALATVSGAHASPVDGFSGQTAERLVRAVEAVAKATEKCR